MFFFSSSHWTNMMRKEARRQKHSKPQTLNLQLGVLPGAEDFARFSIGGSACHDPPFSPPISLKDTLWPHRADARCRFFGPFKR
jgi:hypothetical protein